MARKAKAVQPVRRNIDEWRQLLKESTESIGTYKPEFDAVIETLADILARRDTALDVFYNEQGGKAIVEHTNKIGATNFERNPVCRVIDDLNNQALTYWRELGLTPKGLRAINEQAIGQAKTQGLGALISDLMQEC